MEILNNVNNEQIGGNWACIVGCGSFCFMSGGAASYIAVAATAL